MKKVFAILAVAAVCLCACNKEEPQKGGKKDEPKQEEPKEPEQVAAITIDGDFADWTTLGDKAVIAKTNPDAQWDAVKEIRVYAEGDFIYYYIRFDKELCAEYLSAGDTFPARVNLNTDGEFTSGYSNYFTQAYDFIIELALANGEGGWSDASGAELHQRIDGSWTNLLDGSAFFTLGAGSGYEYELFVDRASFNAAAAGSTVPMPMGDTFQTSMRFYETSSTGDWNELSNIPNSAEGYGPLLEVTFAK